MEGWRLDDEVRLAVLRRADQLTSLSDRIWELAEVGLGETRSAEALAETLAEAGFSVRQGVAGMPTAFVAEWGSGRPVVALLGEYDALPGLSQVRECRPEPLLAGAGGHGCGHNLLGVGALGAALAARDAMAAAHLPGVIRFYGCPAEETLVGKVFMVKAGLFDDIDVALTWHPADVTGIWASSSLSVNSLMFQFTGVAAHAAGNPEAGRSALDGVELMNVGANYLREHVPTEARIHYVITDGGHEPNVVPPRAAVWYYVRAPRRAEVEEITARLMDIARGAALMTGTSQSAQLITGCYNFLPNRVLGDLLLSTLEQVGPPPFSAADQKLAADLQATVPPPQLARSLEWHRRHGLDDTSSPLHCGRPLAWGEGEPGSGSTDVGDVSWVVPTAQLEVASAPLGTPGHSWQMVVSSGTGIGTSGMLVAAQALGAGALAICRDPGLVDRARAELAGSRHGQEYRSPVALVAEPPLGLLEH